MSAKRPRLTRTSLFVVFAFGATTLGADCDGDIVQDPTFRDWCGDVLCAWQLDTGSVAPAPTWNADDLGVSFVDSPTQISQATTESSAQCILFTTVADIDPAAAMSIAVDFNSDGTFESTTTLGSTQWQRVQTEITAPSAYQGITFVLRKAGSGTAILAEMRIQSVTGCTAAPAAIAPASLALGETCQNLSYFDGDGGYVNQCASGLICPVEDWPDQLCSQCSDSVPCPNGVACTARSGSLPSQCGPGQGLGKSGDPCVNGSDCASGDCKGATPVPLADEAGPCELDASLGTDAGSANCQGYGVHGGQCQ